MSLPAGQASFDARLRTMQIIAAAIVVGAVIFFAIALFVRLGGNRGAPADRPILSYVALTVAVFDVFVYWFIPDLVAANTRRQIARGTWTPPQGPRNFPTPTTDAERLWIVFQNRLIIGLALLEGATFFLLIAYLAEGSFLALVPAWVFIIAMLMQFPTRVGVERWVEEQQQLLQEERQTSG